MKEIATIRFVDAESAQEGVAVIRAEEGKVGLALSLLRDGDMEVFLQVEDCRKLVQTLQQAILGIEQARSH